MLTKLLKFDDDVLWVIKKMIWSDDGLLGTLTGQLDRKLYVSVNKALDAMGGKWNKKAGGHIFQLDPRAKVEGLLDAGSIEIARDGFFETPLEVVTKMIKLAKIRPGYLVLEPSAGLGAIARELRKAGASVVCIEFNVQRVQALRDQDFDTGLGDFLTFDPDLESYQAVVMNPPFEEGQEMDHVQHAYKFLDEGGTLVSVMSSGPFHRSDKKATAFRAWLETVGGRSENLPAGSFKESGTGVNTRLVVITKEN